ncbi:MAG TPA: DUF5320 domain-containing protein [Candidatus Pacearchaeota archaeon]|nr:DUF5320 domain-containing protein [Candidatus Pacearchaeota archaeon]
MPNKDKTGPEGKGPKTGRQMGNCEGAEPQQSLGQGRGFGPCGRGQGRGRGLRKRTSQKDTN